MGGTQSSKATSSSGKQPPTFGRNFFFALRVSFIGDICCIARHLYACTEQRATFYYYTAYFSAHLQYFIVTGPSSICWQEHFLYY